MKLDFKKEMADFMQLNRNKHRNHTGFRGKVKRRYLLYRKDRRASWGGELSRPADCHPQKRKQERKRNGGSL